MKKIIAFVLMCVFIISLSACSNSVSTDINASAEVLYSNNNSIDLLIYDNIVYINAKNIDWISDFDFESDEIIGKITRTNVKEKFKNFDATVLDVGTVLYSVSSSPSDSLILVYIDDVAVPYYSYQEG